MSTSKKRWNKIMSIILAAAMIGAVLTPAAVFAQPGSDGGQAQIADAVEEKAEAADVGASESLGADEQDEAAGAAAAAGEDGEPGTAEPKEERKAVDMDSFTQALEIDYSQAAQLPLTGYFFKKIGENDRQVKIYISEHASIRSYFTVIAVPDEVDTETYLEEQGWFDVADANGECLFILEPGEGGWGEDDNELTYVTDAIKFLKSGRNANDIQLFSGFGEFYFVGYGKGANPLMYYAMYNPIFIISQYYTNGDAANTKLMADVRAKEYDGSNTSGYSDGYKDKDEEFDAVLQGLGIEGRLKYSEVPVPTWLNKYSANGVTVNYWKQANDVYENAVDNAFWQKPESKRLATLYANACQIADGKNYGISQVKVTQSSAGHKAEDIYGFLSLYTRYDNTFAYSNNLNWRLGYAPATVEAQANALKSEGTAYTYSITGGEKGEAMFLGDGSLAVTVPGTEEGGIVDVGVIAFSDNGGTKDLDPREYIVYIPDSAKDWGKQGAPVVMLYPGNSQTDRIFLDSTGWWRVANKEGAVIAIVCETYNKGGVTVSHYDSDLFYYALKAHLEQYISKKFDVALDMGRIYGSGQSAGSMATQGFCLTNPEFFAAVASTSGINVNIGESDKKNESIPSYLITGQSDLGNLVPDMEGSAVLQDWADYLITANKAKGSALAATKEYSENPYEDNLGKDLIRWNSKEWANDQEEKIVLVKWSQNILRSHNCYPAEMPMLFDFMKHFSYKTNDNGKVTARYYSESGFKEDDAVLIEFNELPTNDDIESIQAVTDETFYGTGVVQVVVTYKSGTDLKNVTADTYVLEDRGSLNPDFGQVKIESVEVDGRKVCLNIYSGYQATENNKLVYSGSNKEGSRERNVFGIYPVGPWYRDAAGTIHYGSSDEDAYENNTTGQGYQSRACLELRLRHITDDPKDSACLADDKGQYAGEGSLWLPTIDKQFEEGGFRNLYDLKIRSTGQYDKTGIGDEYVRGYYYIPEKYDPANGIVFTLQGQGISYWQLADGTNNAGTGFMYDSATYSWRNKGAIVVNIHDRSTTSKLPEGYDFVIDDVNVMKYFIDTYKITGNIVIQGNSRGTMASDIVIKALAGCLYDPAQQGMGATVELNKRLDKKVYDFTIDTYICQNGTMGGNIWEDDAWDAVVATGMKVWAFDGEQDSNNIENIARYKELCKKAGYSDEWIEENVRLTGYTSMLYYPWGETDHSTTRINGWYFSDAAYYGPDLSIDDKTGEIVYNTKLSDGDKYKLTGYGSAGENDKKDYEYTVYDDLFQVWAFEPAGDPIPVVPVDPTELEKFVTRLYENFLGREPDAGGLAAWVDALESGRATGAKVVSGFVLSQEFQNNPLSNEDYITALYRIIFDREPDPQGLANWLSVLENGCTKKKVLSGFLNSDEFKKLCEGLGVDPGYYKSDELPDLYPDVAGFVARLYTVCLNRSYDQAGLNAWVTVLVTKEATGSKVARGFFHSKEFANRKLNDGEFVRVAYLTILDREPEAAGFENWTKALANGLSRDEVIDGFLASKEFGNLCERYDIVR